jgi:hypothetical protein
MSVQNGGKSVQFRDIGKGEILKILKPFADVVKEGSFFITVFRQSLMVHGLLGGTKGEVYHHRGMVRRESLLRQDSHHRGRKIV